MFEEIVMLDKSNRLVIAALNEDFISVHVERKGVNETWFNKAQFTFFRDSADDIVAALKNAQGRCYKKEKLKEEQQEMFPRDYGFHGDDEC
jgi:hypothetical protein